MAPFLVSSIFTLSLLPPKFCNLLYRFGAIFDLCHVHMRHNLEQLIK
jgi:hypothetical protein